jgi:ATP-dependent 26S proteasome regulatory subunit
MGNEYKLTPAQEAATSGLIGGVPAGEVFVLRGQPGMGKTTVLQKVHEATGGAFLGVRQFMTELAVHEPLAIEEAFLEMLDHALAGHEVVVVDDLHLVTNVVEGFDYTRTYLLDAALTAALGEASAQHKKLIFATAGEAPWPVRRRAYTFEIGGFAAEDYECLCGAYLTPEVSAGLDYARIHRFAPGLNAYQLKNACAWLGRKGAVTTEGLVEYLKAQHMQSNVEIDEVPHVDWNELQGVDDLIRMLEAKIALPFENDALAAQLNLKPKRGVLLAGPPGTGKTTIGRALAHRLKSKFFLIDGTMIAGTNDFYGQVQEVFDAAKRNAPSVIFIDDTDVIFEGSEDRGLYRYLLTMLDGLESASAGRVCVMMTAMNVSSLPQALLRSGRVELWLETRLPGAEARRAIMRGILSKLPAPMAAANVAKLASASRGLTGADLKAVVEDGKLLFAHDMASGKAARPVEEYFLEAIETVRANQSNYAKRKPVGIGRGVTMGFTAGFAAGAEFDDC